MAEFLTEDVKQKWAKVIDHPELPAIKESWKKKVTTVMLENTAREMAKAQQLRKMHPPTRLVRSRTPRTSRVLIRS